MSITHEQRLSDSPYVETVTHGWTMSDGSSIRPAESNWHMVFVKAQGRTHSLLVGPLPTAGKYYQRNGQWSIVHITKGVSVGKVTFDMSMSLDGYVTGANARLQKLVWVGSGGEQLHNGSSTVKIRATTVRDAMGTQAWLLLGGHIQPFHLLLGSGWSIGRGAPAYYYRFA